MREKRVLVHPVGPQDAAVAVGQRRVLQQGPPETAAKRYARMVGCSAALFEADF